MITYLVCTVIPYLVCTVSREEGTGSWTSSMVMTGLCALVLGLQ